MGGGGAGDSINSGRIKTDASKLPNRVRRPENTDQDIYLSPKSKLPKAIAINAKLTPRPGAQTSTNPFRAEFDAVKWQKGPGHQTKGSHEDKLGQQTIVIPFPEKLKSPTSRTRNPTWSGLDNRSGGNLLRHGSGSWDKPNYPIFGHSAHSYQQNTPDIWLWRDQDWLRQEMMNKQDMRVRQRRGGL